MSILITPTIGRIVWFRPARPTVQPLAAIICYVHTDRLVNLAVFTSSGVNRSHEKVPLLQENDVALKGECYCEWMTYQISQAKKEGV